MKLIRWAGLLVGVGTALVFSVSPAAASWPGQGDDTLASIGSFRLYVAAPFRPLVTGCPNYNPATFRLQPPDLSDAASVIGRSNPIQEGSGADLNGVAVGTAGTIIKDSDMTAVPSGFEQPPGPRREVHTELRQLDLEMSGAPPYVKAGVAAPSRPVSPGEVESLDATGTPANDFPATSFFDIFLEMKLPQCGTASADLILNNPWPLALQNPSISAFPPDAIYLHANPMAVLVRFATVNPGQWKVGDVFGWLVLGGYGAGFDVNTPADVAAFDAAIAGQQEMPVPPLTCMFDLDHGLRVAFGDLLQFAQAYNSQTGGAAWNAAADFNGNGQVAFADLLLFAQKYNQNCTQFQLPIDHIVVLMQENRSFDHYFGQLRAYDPTLDVEALPAGASNPNPGGGAPIQAFHQTLLCDIADVSHSWNASHRQWNNGAMDGFTTQNVVPVDPTGSRAMGYYNENELPYYYELYSTFAISDRFFSSLLGPTFPNRFYLLGGTSFGHIRNDIPLVNTEFSQPTIFNLLDQAAVTWKIYVSPPVSFAPNEFAYVRNQPANLAAIQTFFTDAAAGTLPQVAFIEPIFIGSKNVENDEHPPANVQVGQKFSADVINALFTSPNWSSTAFFLTYDEHGGYYDHVPPAAAIVPDGIPPMLQGGDDPGAFDRLGIRVPVVVVSPYSRNHYVSHVVHDHTSILRFIEDRFGLAALSNRDRVADPMFEFFNFQNPPFATPPSLPPAAVDLTRPECN